MTEIPMVIVRACGRALPRLHAEESLRAADRLSVGSGRNRIQSRMAMDEWRRQAYPRTGPRPRAVPATPEQLAMMGIGYSVEPPRDTA